MAAYALGNLCCSDAENRRAAGDGGAVAAVVERLMGSLSPALRDHGAFVLGSLCCDDPENQWGALRAGGSPVGRGRSARALGGRRRAPRPPCSTLLEAPGRLELRGCSV